MIDASYATGTVSDTHTSMKYDEVVGGLVGESTAAIANSYATGAVTVGAKSLVGGFAGYYAGPSGFSITACYSTGAVNGGTASYIGGLIGDDSNQGQIADSDWDTDTSGITDLGQGVGNIENFPGVTGLTTAQFQSGLPAGFDPAVWAENSNINGGLPYLIANPPPS
jgi:hypothetical protein